VTIRFIYPSESLFNDSLYFILLVNYAIQLKAHAGLPATYDEKWLPANLPDNRNRTTLTIR